MDAGANVQAKNSQGESSVLSLQTIDLREEICWTRLLLCGMGHHRSSENIDRLLQLDNQIVVHGFA